jgi:hypothetical protein
LDVQVWLGRESEITPLELPRDVAAGAGVALNPTDPSKRVNRLSVVTNAAPVASTAERGKSNTPPMQGNGTA